MEKEYARAKFRQAKHRAHGHRKHRPGALPEGNPGHASNDDISEDGDAVEDVEELEKQERVSTGLDLEELLQEQSVHKTGAFYRSAGLQESLQSEPPPGGGAGKALVIDLTELADRFSALPVHELLGVSEDYLECLSAEDLAVLGHTARTTTQTLSHPPLASATTTAAVTDTEPASRSSQQQSTPAPKAAASRAQGLLSTPAVSQRPTAAQAARGTPSQAAQQSHAVTAAATLQPPQPSNVGMGDDDFLDDLLGSKAHSLAHTTPGAPSSLRPPVPTTSSRPPPPIGSTQAAAKVQPPKPSANQSLEDWLGI